jgi:outer membrane protein assembly factor BamB
VYYTANRELRAVEASTGKLLWRIESPDRRKNDSAVFKGFVAAVAGKGGQKGRVYAHTGLNAYCYEAIR